MADIKNSIFYLDKGELRFNEIGILFDPAFAKLFRRKHEIAGDSQGRNKIRNFQEAKYIYLVADPLSQPNRKGLDSKDAHAYAVGAAGLPNDWTPDELVSMCIQIYRKDSWTVVHEHIYELNATFNGYSKIVGIIRSNLDTLLAQPKLKKDEVSELMNYYRQLLSMAADIPKIQLQLKEALKQLAEVDDTDEWEHMRGSTGGVPDSAEPSNELRR